MAISNTNAKAQYTGNGGTTSFGFSAGDPTAPIPYFAPADIVVLLFDTTANQDVSPAPVLNGGGTYDYQITGAAQDSTGNTGEYSGASILFNTAPPANYRITLERIIAATQGAVLKDNNKLPTQAINGGLDRLTMIAQQLEASAGATLRFPDSDPISLDGTLPASAIRAGKLLAFALDGTPTAQQSIGTWRGTWATATSYAVGDLVIDGAAGANTGNVYVCATAHMSGVWATDLAAIKWNLALSVAAITAAAATLATVAAVAAVATVPFMQCRLTLQSGVPVMSSNQTAKSTVYLTPYKGNRIIAAGSNRTFTEVSLALDSNSGHIGYQQSGKNFDLFIVVDTGALLLGTGPAWSSATARGTGAGTTELALVNGIWVNANTISLKTFAGAGSPTSYGVGQATYVGTMYATADGQTGMAYSTSASGGGANILGLWNNYNRETVHALNIDSKASWTYASGTPQPLDGGSSNTANRFSWVDGLQLSFARMQTQVNCINVSNGSVITGHLLNAISGTPVNALQSETNNWHTPQTAGFPILPQLGFNYAQAMEWIATSTGTFGGAQSSFTVEM